MTYRYNIFIACDSEYHEQWARELIRTVQFFNPTVRIVVLVINPHDIQEIPNVVYHYREQQLTDNNRVAYYQAARFLWAHEIFEEHDLVLCLDADTICTRAFTRSQFWRLTRQPHMLWHDKSERWLAGLVTFGRDPAFLRDLQQRLLEVPIEQWQPGHDQNVLRSMVEHWNIQPCSSIGHWISIGKGSGTFLTLKGEQKQDENRLRAWQLIDTAIRLEPPTDLPLVRAAALVGPWLEGLPLPRLTTVQKVTLHDVSLQDLPDVWIIHNNPVNKRSKRHREAYQLIRDSGLPFVVVESPAFRFNQARPDTPGVYYRWSWFSYFQDVGIHHQPNCSNDRWLQIQSEQNIVIHSWQPRGDNILFLLQRPGDSSMAPMIERWGSYENMIMHTIAKIRRITDRPIRLRLHPMRQDQQMEWLDRIMTYYSNVAISRHSQAINDTWVSGGDGLYRDFDQAWAVVGGNSNGLTESACYGVPTWCLDASAMAWPVSQRDINRIESPNLTIDRQQWLNNLGYCQWRRDEILRGDPWFHLLQWWPEVQQLRQHMQEWSLKATI